jgi:hypothetical protein
MSPILSIFLFFAPLPPGLPVDGVSGECRFGEIVQTGRNVAINGPLWPATGSARADGAFILFWRPVHQAAAVGVYRLEGGALVGHWGWAEDVEITDDGDICHVEGRALANERIEIKR